MTDVISRINDEILGIYPTFVAFLLWLVVFEARYAREGSHKIANLVICAIIFTWFGLARILWGLRIIDTQTRLDLTLPVALAGYGAISYLLYSYRTYLRQRGAFKKELRRMKEGDAE